MIWYDPSHGSPLIDSSTVYVIIRLKMGLVSYDRRGLALNDLQTDTLALAHVNNDKPSNLFIEWLTMPTSAD